MASTAAGFSSSPSLSIPPQLRRPRRLHLLPALRPLPPAAFLSVRAFPDRTGGRRGVSACSSDNGASSYPLGGHGSEDGGSAASNISQKSALLALIQEIEPLDVSLIQKDVPPTTVDAIKRTISGMLGLLPSDQFQVYIDALWEPLSKLLVSSMMTGYTLRNAEYRLYLERNLDMHEESPENQRADRAQIEFPDIDSSRKISSSGRSDFSSKYDKGRKDKIEEINIEGFSEISEEAQDYIIQLQSQLSSAKKELHEVKRKTAALQMQQFVGEEKNDILDYLRSLQPEKVAELSEPTSTELRETVHSVVHGLLATLSPKMHSKVHSSPENSVRTVNAGGEDHPDAVESASLQFQPLISLTRDYLARLLFWCMLLGHHLRGLEYKMELMELLSRTADPENDITAGPQVS
ncbi:hypothetical protein MLD38_013419 [Melastoma candidum]|uniref:Uncharacterized protein n=1 Tax=Melastoma candidum TaxID=119954 RepID=A0ACB9R9K5_9MYRT|nr:hypothetical protein MLD38_013419 [Melastoma candidum]